MLYNDGMKEFAKSMLVAVLIAEAKMLLARTKPAIIVVTGNVGKTSTKDAIYSVLKNRLHIRKSEKSYNSEFGVPFSILGIENPGTNVLRWLRVLLEGLIAAINTKDYPDVLVLEIGVDRPGDMDRFTGWIKPDVIVLTRFPDIPVHVEYFPTADAVAEEKIKILKALKPDGVVIYNHDDERIVKAVSDMRQKTIGFSRYSRSAFTGASETMVHEHGVPTGFEFILNTNEISRVVRVNGALGTSHVYVYCAAVAVATLFEIPIDEAITSLREHRVAPGRLRLLPGVKGSHILDDTYNASPTAVEEALRALRGIKNAKRKIAVLGDMLELGQYSIEEHSRIGSVVAESADLLMTVGVRARGIAEGALRSGMHEDSILQYNDIALASRDLESFLKEGDFVLVKASQGMRFEKIVEEIMAEPERAEELLVRQDRFWKK